MRYVLKIPRSEVDSSDMEMDLEDESSDRPYDEAR